MKYITELSVTYIPNPPEGFSRFGALSTPAYLWCKKSDDDAITGLSIIYDDDEPLAGWIKIPQDLNRDRGDPSYLCYTKNKEDQEEKGLMMAKVVGEDEAIGTGFERVEESITRSGDALYLAISNRETREQDYLPKRVGEIIDCMDTIKKWCVGTVQKMEKDRVEVHYRGWSDKWNAWVPLKQGRIARYRTHTHGETDPDENRSAFRLNRDKVGYLENLTASVVRLIQKDEWEGKDDTALSEIEMEVKRILNAVVDEPPVIQIVLFFLEKVLELAIEGYKRAAPIPTCCLYSLVRVFGSDTESQRFYQKYGIGDNKKLVHGEFAIDKPNNSRWRHDQLNSSHLLDNINIFGKKQGFEYCLQRMTIPTGELIKEETTMCIKSIRFTLMAFGGSCRSHMNPEFLKKFVPRLKDIIESRLNNITDQELKEAGRTYVNHIITDLGAFMKEINDDDEEVDEALEMLKIKMTLRLMKCKALEKRIQGMLELKEIINCVEPRMFHYQQQRRHFYVITPDFLTTWLKEKKIVSILLTKDAHNQIIKRIPTILGFLAIRGALLTKHLDLLWNCSIGQHESTITVVYEAITQLSNKLSDRAHFDHLFRKIRAIPLEKYNERILQLLQDLTASAIRSVSERNPRGDNGTEDEDDDEVIRPTSPAEQNWYGVGILWDLVQDDAKVDNDIAEQAQMKLLEQLKIYEELRRMYLPKCLENIKAFKSGYASMRILRKCLDYYPRPHINLETNKKQMLLDKMITNQGLDKLFFEDMKRHRDRCQKVIKERLEAGVIKPEDLEGKKPDSLVLISRWPHKNEIIGRMVFLKTLIHESSVFKLTEEYMDVLWDTLVINSATGEDKNHLFPILNDIVCGEMGYHRQYSTKMSRALATYTLKNLFCDAEKLPPSGWTVKGLEAFKHLFLFVNQMEQKLDYKNEAFWIKDHDLIGMDTVWRVSIDAGQAKVAQECSEFLISLYFRSSMQVDKRLVAKKFLKRVMATVVGVLEDNRGLEKKRIGQAFNLLEKFLVRSEAKSRHTIDKYRLSMTFKSETSNQTEDQISVSVVPEVTIERVRTELAKHKNIKRECIKLVFDGHVIYSSRMKHVTVKDLGCKDGSEIICYALLKPIVEPPPERSVKKVTLPHHARCDLTSNDDYFLTLFKVLQLGSPIADKVWSLLERSPTHPPLLEDMTYLQSSPSDVGTVNSEVRWDALLPVEDPLRLLYALDLMEAIFKPRPDDTKEDDKKIEDWCSKFLNSGGLHHLYKAIVSVHLEELFKERFPLECLHRLLKILGSFLDPGKPWAAKSELIAEESFDFERLVTRLCQIVFEAGRSKAINAVSSTGGEMMDDDDESEMGGETWSTQCLNRTVIDMATSLLVGILRRKTELYNVVLTYPSLKADLIAGLLDNENSSIRQGISRNIIKLCLTYQDALFNVDALLDSDIKCRTLLNSDSKEDQQVASPLRKRPKLADSKAKQLTPIGVFLPLLLSCFDRLKGNSNCGQFFVLVTNLFERKNRFASASITSEGRKELHSIAKTITRMLLDHPIQERSRTSQDTVLQGLLGLLASILDQESELAVYLKDAFREVLYKVLFEIPTPESAKLEMPPPKAKNKVTRERALLLLERLAYGCADLFQELLVKLISLHQVSHSKGRARQEWDFTPMTEEKSETGLVGIKNLGCTCYMNALIQQVYMIPELRQALLDYKDTAENLDDSFFYQFQYVLAFLQESNKQFIQPARFVHSFKGWDGEPTNVSVQMDAQEFFNMLFDRIDERLKQTVWEKALADNIAGEFSNELIAKANDGEMLYIEKVEPFFCLSCVVMNKKDITEGLQALVTSEELSGDNAYMWDSIKQKKDTNKRICIKTLPQNLVIQLKRFTFNFETMQKIKINSKLEFPEILDMYPYTKEGLFEQDLATGLKTKWAMRSGKKKPKKSDEKKIIDGEEKDVVEDEESQVEDRPPKHPDWYYKYRLSGVVVHTGSANGGHYYSFIKRKDDGKWFFFDDALVQEWDKEQLANECFGGEEFHWQQTGLQEKRRNAYLLFYERIEDPELKEEDKKPRLNKCRIDPIIYDHIWDENLAYWIDQFTYDRDYFEFIKNIIAKHKPEFSDVYNSVKDPSAQKSPSHTQLISQLGIQFIFETFSRSVERTQLEHITINLLKLLSAHLPSCHWIISRLVSEERRHWNTELLLQCENRDVRFACGELICTALRRCLKYESKYLPKDEELIERERTIYIDDAESKEDNLDLPLTTRFIDIVLEDLKHCNRYWKSFENYFRVLWVYASHGRSQQIYLARSGVIAKMVDLYLGEQSPAPATGLCEWAIDNKGQRLPMGDAWEKPTWTHFWALLSCVATRCDPEATSSVGSLPFSNMDRKFILDRNFLSRMITQGKTDFVTGYLKDIVELFAKNNNEFSETLIGLIFQGIEESCYSDMPPYFAMVEALVQVNDALAKTRIHSILSSFVNVMEMSRHFWKETLLCIEELIYLADFSEECADWLKRRKDLHWTILWMKKHPRSPPFTHERESGELPMRVCKPDDFAPVDYQGNVPGRLSSVQEKWRALERVLCGEELDDQTRAKLNKKFALNVGMQVDARTVTGNWEEAKVTEVSQHQVTVGYEEFGSMDTLLVHSDRIARHRTQSTRKLPNQHDKILKLAKFT